MSFIQSQQLLVYCWFRRKIPPHSTFTNERKKLKILADFFKEKVLSISDGIPAKDPDAARSPNEKLSI
jgi:hypothetical protein